PNTTVLVVGYQSAGTVGRAITEGAKTVRIDHQEVEVHAKIDIIGSYSAHADQVKLLKWVTSSRKMPKKVYLNHGEPHAQETLAQKIRDTFAVDVAIPAPGDNFTHP
ncbi:MAG TPA: MBL fold metallo-hydrolase RNA specificity domain-containing protein, partial [Candidatus Eisenbacteria bacterium]|nr:MBL fold metallo-hydrolase RNA specificity domain-containing protein [Candidatus Eisenbacteria bacterium]